ncbi:helix-turn-helix domain-containing protein [Streptomyces coelicoflavus]|uniref:helix-turn-helix domain-containing protein n=1 Tax=Streptomyces coelicoflavus TaxID=285562 RepID=UPI003F4A8580
MWDGGQIWDTGGMEEQNALPTSDVEIGARLKQLRGRRSLRDLAEVANVTKSTLSRYESGTTAIPFAVAKALDQAYGAAGWIEAAVASVGWGRWEPWKQATSQRSFAHRWPAQHQGLVWVLIRPSATRIGQSHEVVLRWGSWVCDVSIDLSGPGTVILTGKDRDEVAVTCNLECSQPVYALWGIGEHLPESAVLDIRQEWRTLRKGGNEGKY